MENNNVSLDDEIASARGEIIADLYPVPTPIYRRAEGDEIFDAAVALLRPKLDAANAALAELCDALVAANVELAEKDAEIARLRQEHRHHE